MLHLSRSGIGPTLWCTLMRSPILVNSIIFMFLYILFRVVKDFSNEVFVNKYYTHVLAQKIVQLTNLCEIGKYDSDETDVLFEFYVSFRCQYCRLQKCLRVGMRVEAVQNERRPYTSSIDNRHELMAHSINNQRVLAQNETISINPVRKME